MPVLVERYVLQAIGAENYAYSLMEAPTVEELRQLALDAREHGMAVRVWDRMNQREVDLGSALIDPRD